MIPKIERPRIPAAIPRCRLFQAIDRCRGRKRALWISGPPGAGKTTLAASYLKSRRLPGLWYRLDEGDEDLATFFYYLGLAVKHAVPAQARPLPLFTPEYMHGLTAFTRAFFQALSKAALARRPSRDAKGRERDFFLVLDNYQKVPPEADLHQALAHGLDILPETIRVIFISRSTPPVQFARLRAQKQLDFIDWEEMRLTCEESEMIIHRLSKAKPDRGAARKLHAMSEGWPAGLVLLLERLKQNVAVELLDALPREGIFSYFSGEIFDATDPGVQAFLMKTSFLPQMTASMARHISGQADADSLLNTLYHDHFFMERHLGSPPMYGFHPLFREFLMHQAGKAFSPEEIRRIKQTSAALLDGIGRVEDAAALYLQAADWRGIEKMVKKRAPRLIAQGRNHLLARWIESISESSVLASPALLFWRGVARLPFQPAQARSDLEMAFGASPRKNRLKALAWAAIIDAHTLEWNDFTPLDKWIHWMEGALETGFGFADPEVEARVAASMSTALMLRQPHHPEIDRWMERALTLARELPDINFRGQTYLLLVIFYFWRGDLVLFKAFIAEIEKLASQPEAAWRVRLALPWLAGFADTWLLGDPESGIQKIDTALSHAEESGVFIWNPNLLSLRAYCLLARGDVEAAEKALATLAGMLNGASKHMYCKYYYLLAWCSYRGNEKEVARVQAATALDYAEITGHLFARILCMIQHAWLTFEAGDPENAHAGIQKAHALACRTGSHMLEHAALLVEAGILLDSGRENAGLEKLERGMALGRKHGYPAPPWWGEPDLVPRLCAYALNHGIETAHVKSVILKMRFIPVRRLPAGTCRHWPWPVKICTFGRFELFRWGEPVQFSGKGRKKPLDMIKILIALGGNEVRKEVITDLLWPDAEGDLAHKSFATTLHRLRQLLGEKEAIRLHQGRVTLDSRYCWVDVLDFLERTAEWEAYWNRNPDPDALLQAESLFETYRNSSLAAEMDGSWAVAFKDRLQRKYLRFLEIFGKHRERRGEMERAAAIFEKGIEVDPLAEPFYQHLMVIYHRLGWSAEVVRTYQRCCEALAAALDVQPSERLSRMFHKLSAEPNHPPSSFS